MEIKRILLTKGKTALVDAADFDWLDQWEWHLTTPTGYAARGIAERAAQKAPMATRINRILIVSQFLFAIIS